MFFPFDVTIIHYIYCRYIYSLGITSVAMISFSYLLILFSTDITKPLGNIYANDMQTLCRILIADPAFAESGVHHNPIFHLIIDKQLSRHLGSFAWTRNSCVFIHQTASF